MQIISRQLDEKIIDEDEYMMFGDKINNECLGTKLIMNVLKVDVVKVEINKIESEPKTYRYRGSIVTGGKDAVKYDKAWNANKKLFQYKAYNMDPNNETPLECVPNALFKMYGDKTKEKHIITVKLLMVEWNT